MDDLLDAVTESMDEDADATAMAPPAPKPSTPDESMEVHLGELLDSVKESVDAIEPTPHRGPLIAARTCLLGLRHADLRTAHAFYGRALALERRDDDSYWIGQGHALALLLTSSVDDATLEPAAGIVIDFAVADVDHTFGLLVLAGAEIVQPPQKRAGAGRRAIFRDPAGYTFAVSSA